MKKHLILSVFLLVFQYSYCQNLEWTFETEGSFHSTPVMEGEVLYVGSGDKNIYALHKTTGKKLWSFEGDGAIYSDVGLGDNIVTFGNDTGSLYGLDKSSGKLVWKFNSKGEKKLDLWDYYLSSPVVYNSLVYWGSSDGHIYAIKIETGEVAWQFDTGAMVHASPVIEDGKVLIGNYSGEFFALDTGTGEEIWKFQAVGTKNFPNAEFQKAALVKDGVVYVGSRDFNLYALNLKTGRGIWNIQEKGGSWVVATPFIHENSIYFGTSDTYKFNSLKKANGRENWSIPIGTRAYGSAIAYKNLILFPGFDGIIRGVDPSNGELCWEFQSNTSKENYASIYDNGKFRKDINVNAYTQKSEALILSLGSFINSPLLDQNILYAASVDGNLYAIKID